MRSPLTPLSSALFASQLFVAKALALEPPEVEGLAQNAPTDKQGVKDIALQIVVYILDFVTIIAVGYIIWAGIKLITSGGEDEKKDEAKKSILYVIVGLIVVLLARVIVTFFASETTYNDVSL